MNFFSHKIANPTGNTVKWDDYLAKLLKSAEDKQASEAKPECDGDPRGQGRGQVINNDNEEGAHSYQEGESVDGKSDQAEGSKKSKKKDEPVEAQKKEAHCAKDMGECDKAGKETEDHADAENADVGDAQVQQCINNDPCYQKGESTSPGKVDGKNKKTKGAEASSKRPVSKTAQKKRGFKKIACMNQKEKLDVFAHMTSLKTKSGTPQYPMAYVEAMIGVTYANLKDEEKTWFKKFWSTMYPEQYVSEMVAER